AAAALRRSRLIAAIVWGWAGTGPEKPPRKSIARAARLDRPPADHGPARMAEPVDARDLGSRGATRPSSSLGPRTIAAEGRPLDHPPRVRPLGGRRAPAGVAGAAARRGARRRV